MKLWRYGRTIEWLSQRYRLACALGRSGMPDVKEAAQIAQWQHPTILHIYSDLQLELLTTTWRLSFPLLGWQRSRA